MPDATYPNGMDPPKMNLASWNVGLSREVTWRGTRTTTAIYKQPVGGRVSFESRISSGVRAYEI
jgi:hypothetical protein